MTQLKRIVILVIALATMLTLSVSSIFAQGDASIRFVHVIPDAVSVDVYVNGTLAVEDLDYGSASLYLNVPAGDHTVTATATGLTAPLWEQSISIGADSATTFIAADASNPQFAAFSDNLNTLGFGTSRLAIVHALAGGPTVSVELAEELTIGEAVQDAGTVIVPEVAFGEKFGEFDVPANNVVVNVNTTDGATVLESVALPLVSNTSHFAVVYGTADNPQAMVLSAPTTPADDAGFVRFIHGIVDGPAVNVVVNDSLIAPNLTPDTPTEHIALPAGDHTVALLVDGDTIGEADITVNAGAAQSVAALLVDGELELTVFEDDLSGIDEVTAGVNVLNAIDGSEVVVSLTDGTELGAADAAEQSGTTNLEATASGTTFTLSIDDQEGTIEGQDVVLYGGVYYNVIVLDGSVFGAPSLVVAPTALALTLGSAPNAGEATVDASVPAATEAPADETVDEAEAVATEVPAPVTIADDVIIGEVALDPSANLNLRQFPNANALVLGQAPSGSRLIINGREGRPVALVEGQDPPPEAETFVDPVEELGEGQDLDSTATWVNVTYNTPDGGTITAWVLAQFLIVSDDEGLFALRDLEPFPGNIAGEASNTDVTPPVEPEDIVTAEVINITNSANLNIRRNPNAESEVIGQLDLGNVVELLGLLPVEGILEDAEWAFISFSPSEGGVITGWVSTSFIQYQLNSEDTPLDELIEEGLVEAIDEERIGEIGPGTAPVTAATPDPQVDAYVGEVALDPGANLNLRRDPDAQSEVLVQIPAGSFIIIEARTEDGDWFRTSFEGQVGWVASQFLIVTFNGDFVEDTSEIEVDTTPGE